MATAIVIYYSRSGNTKQMAEYISDAMNSSGVNTKCKSVEDVKVDNLLDYDAIVIGSPCYYGHMAGPVAQFFDESVQKHGKLDGKIGAAFTSSANIGGGKRNNS